MAIHEQGRRPGRRLRMPGVILAAVDATAWAFAVVAAMALRFDFRFDRWSDWNPIGAIGIAAAAMVAAGAIGGLYDGRWQRGSPARWCGPAVSWRAWPRLPRRAGLRLQT